MVGDVPGGVAIFRPQGQLGPHHEFYSDASGSFGCGAIWGDRWLQLKWPPSFATVVIAPKELIPVVMACAIWGRAWKGQVIQVHCDNQAVVSVLNSGYSRDDYMMKLIRTLSFFAAEWDIHLVACHIPGISNVVADAISRNDMHTLFSKVPRAASQPMPMPDELLHLLLTPSLDWTDTSWSRMFRDCLRRV